MIDLNEAAARVIDNRIKRGFPSAFDLSRSVKGMREEVEEFAEALVAGDVDEQVDALIDELVYCIGGVRMLGRDVEEELLKVLANNEKRPYRRHH